MVISARLHYACLAMLDLAIEQHRGTPVAASEIADRHGVPGPFLVQILRDLRTAGWIESVRGSQGGYRLAVSADQVTLLEIAEAIGCQEGGCKAESKPTLAGEMLQEVWERAHETSRRVLAETKLSRLVEQCRHGDATMFYI